MINKLKLALTAFLAAATLFAMAPGPSLAADCPANPTTQQAIQCGINGASGTSNAQTPKQATDTFNNLLSTALNILSVVAGIVAVVMIIFGGFRYITSAGSDEKVKSAKKSLLYAVIGLAIVALAQVIVQFVLSKATSTPQTTGASSSTSSTCANGQLVC